MSVILSFHWKTEGEYKVISWALYTENDELLEEGDYKVWRFIDLIEKPEDVHDVEECFDVEYVKKQLQKIIKKYNVTLQPSSNECWEQFCEYANMSFDIPKKEGIAEILEKQEEFKPIAKKSVEEQFAYFSGSKRVYKTPSQQVYFIYQKIVVIVDVIKYDSTFIKLKEQHNPVIKPTNFSSNKSTNYNQEQKKSWQPNWGFTLIGILLFIIGIGMLNDRSSSNNFVGVICFLVGIIIIYSNLFRWK